MYVTLERLQAENNALRAKVRKLTGEEPGQVRLLTPYERFRSEVRPLLDDPLSDQVCMAAVRDRFGLSRLDAMTDRQLPEAIAFVRAWVMLL